MRSQRGGWAGGVGEPADLPLPLSLSLFRARARAGRPRPTASESQYRRARDTADSDLSSRLVSFRFVAVLPCFPATRSLTLSPALGGYGCIPTAVMLLVRAASGSQ